VREWREKSEGSKSLADGLNCLGGKILEGIATGMERIG